MARMFGVVLANLLFGRKQDVEEMVMERIVLRKRAVNESTLSATLSRASERIVVVCEMDKRETMTMPLLFDDVSRIAASLLHHDEVMSSEGALSFSIEHHALSHIFSEHSENLLLPSMSAALTVSEAEKRSFLQYITYICCLL